MKGRRARKKKVGVEYTDTDCEKQLQAAGREQEQVELDAQGCQAWYSVVARVFKACYDGLMKPK